MVSFIVLELIEQDFEVKTLRICVNFNYQNKKNKKVKN